MPMGNNAICDTHMTVQATYPVGQTEFPDLGDDDGIVNESDSEMSKACVPVQPKAVALRVFFDI